LRALILFVDHDPSIAMSTTEMLEDLGHRVIGANSGLHALDILKSEQQIDLMMTDAELPEGAEPDLPRLAKPCRQDELRDRLEQLLL
jgi:CheY-like chemotaxis protein